MRKILFVLVLVLFVGSACWAENNYLDKIIEKAERGDSNALMNLSTMYFLGATIPKDNIEAYKYVSIAFSYGEDTALRNLRIIEREMTQEQVDEAQRLANLWIEEHEVEMKSNVLTHLLKPFTSMFKN